MNNFSGSPHITNQRRYLTVAVSCSVVPILLIVLLPEPLRSRVLPIAAVFVPHALLYGLAFLLLGLEWVWNILRKPSSPIISCPACHTTEEPYRRFFVTRVTSQIVRVHCPECHERWMERR